MTASTPPPAVAGRRVSKEFSQLVRLSIPIAFVQLGVSLMSFVDTAMAGRISGTALAAAGLGGSLFFVVSVASLGIVLGVDPLASQAIGAGEDGEARRLLWQGFYTATLAAIPSALVACVVAMSLEKFGVVPELAEATRSYLFARIISLWPFLWVVAMRTYLQAHHHTRAIVVSTLVANVFNFAANGVLGFGDAGLEAVGLPGIGLPALGVIGLALASSIASLGQALVLSIAVAKTPMPEGLQHHRQIDPARMKRIFTLGLPIGLMLLAEVGIFSLAQVFVGGMGVEKAAAHQVALMLASLSFSVCLGVGSATAVQVGRAIGAQDLGAARRAGYLGMVIGAGFMFGPGLAMAFAPEVLARVLTTDPTIVPLASSLLRIAAVFQLADGVQAVATGALRGTGDTRFAFGAHLVSHWVIGLPVSLTLAYVLGFGVQGLWWGLTAGLVAVAIVLGIKFARVELKRV